MHWRIIGLITHDQIMVQTITLKLSKSISWPLASHTHSPLRVKWMLSIQMHLPLWGERRTHPFGEWDEGLGGEREARVVCTFPGIWLYLQTSLRTHPFWVSGMDVSYGWAGLEKEQFMGIRHSGKCFWDHLVLPILRNTHFVKNTKHPQWSNCHNQASNLWPWFQYKITHIWAKVLNIE